MALKRIRLVVSLYPSAEDYLEELQLTKKQLQTKRKRQAIFWEIVPPDHQQDHVFDTSALLKHYQNLETAILLLPETISRIQSAADLLFREGARGYFLPFGTVALGAIARIRVLLLRLAVPLQGQISIWASLRREITDQELPVASVQQTLYQLATSYLPTVDDDDDEVASPPEPLLAEQSAQEVALNAELSYKEAIAETEPVAPAAASQSNDAMDRNMAVVEHLKQSKKKAKKPKKTKDKNKKKDFFDQLFS
jgi:hypothetical protein